jgi:hypothetical protein
VAYGSYLSRQGNKDEALKVFKAFDEQLPRHPLITDALNDITCRKRVPTLIDRAGGRGRSAYGLGPGRATGRRSASSICSCCDLSGADALMAFARSPIS